MLYTYVFLALTALGTSTRFNCIPVECYSPWLHIHPAKVNGGGKILHQHLLDEVPLPHGHPPRGDDHLVLLQGLFEGRPQQVRPDGQIEIRSHVSDNEINLDYLLVLNDAAVGGLVAVLP